MQALIAGGGGLPAAIVAAMETRPFICAFEATEPEGLTPDLTFRVETLGTLLAELKGQGVKELCMAGAVTRPQIDPLAIDTATLPLVPVIMEAMAQGDDGTLRTAIRIFEGQGFTVLGAHEIAPHLLMAPGCPTLRQPGEAEERDAARGADVVAAMSAVDIGQACAVRGGLVVAVETVFGTDWMLASLVNQLDVLQTEGGILYKAPKTGQERRADLPTIGPETIRAAADAGLAGVVIEAEGVLVLDREAVIADCDRLELFLWSRAP
ncbi:LpxI family protein [Chachezhania antarctica]|uniref:LpxI family protein n=1 Tax=Chachezhania antarctica TaxID=2340860 RepID=UPI000EAD3801|nr:UDP-2,3-diacylglucosamine diphosphatase LpxI [Chachezhania antarctica]|tara:strand:- start:1438 stop:2235 length:798 start_codon:yes stop_codon:yes gene_type:complete